ncbi:hypothetical protein PHYSODRAFT_531244 [Phytophthora sojae]|uniref:Uncharacterized protein n=1 Tax=Phytophthora sojae (strain P6497) TaxID=1094619 RepID=G5AD67_PHYSP|nr:hypothetical protein PHYSODRAFT_531244 [Phytophthora sojae]EGZ06120.1 hypothetical protein PHYSODRAFT_531244 [Phytophthora sojae]|eukprot:XP_009538017.1 hypothetical protein PHYSODRAFT_531244 [Phytophthora sojae]
MLSIVFPYRKVVLCFLLPGHSHNVADRVVAWCRKATQTLNLYTPSDLLKEVNNAKGVSGVKYFLPPPSGYTANYLFEIDQGICTARKTVDSPDSESIFQASIASVQLPRHPIKELPEKKMKSLAAKYFTIPPQYFSYYPSVPEAILNAPVQDGTTPGGLDTDDQGAHKQKQKKRKPGRPRKSPAHPRSNQPSIPQFFSAKPASS